MRREAESDPLALAQCERILSRPHQIGNIKKLLSDGLGDLPGHPSRIACTCEIEYHIDRKNTHIYPKGQKKPR